MTKKTPKTSAVLALYVTEVRESDYFHLRASAVWIGRTPSELRDIDNGRTLQPVPSDRIRNVDRYAYMDLQLDLDELLLNSQGSSSDTPRRLYAWELEYRNVYSVDTERAVRMAKTLTTIRKRMDKITDQYGRPATFGAYLLRVANAIGATRLVFAQDATRSSYDDRTHRILSLQDGACRADGMVHAWIDEPNRTLASV